MSARRGFASDNNSGVHPQVLEAIARANEGHVLAYGDDPVTERATRAVRDAFGGRAEVFFVFNGTAANVLGLQALVKPHHAILCAEGAHLNVDECAAPERFLGSKLLTVPAPDGKVTVEALETRMTGIGDAHRAQPKVVSVTESTELGTVYRPEELRRLADWAHARGLYVHMDGARLSNAAAGLGLPLRAVTTDVGVDVLSFGGTKNGLLGGEAVVFLDPALAADFQYVRKQGMQLASKMRFIAAQFEAFLADDLWRRSAERANAMARLLAAEAARVPGVRLARPVEANEVFAFLPPAAIPVAQAEWPFYVWDEARHEVRWVASFDTTEDDVRGLVATLRRACAAER